jgi:hypothetical protein
VKEAPILLLPEIRWTGLSRENAVAARPEAKMMKFVSLTILPFFVISNTVSVATFTTVVEIGVVVAKIF